jgi:hypothetical protein
MHVDLLRTEKTQGCTEIVAPLMGTPLTLITVVGVVASTARTAVTLIW